MVLADGEHGVEQLLGRVALGQGGPRGVGHDGVAVQLVGRSQQRGLERIPTRRVGAGGDALDVVIGEAALLAR